MKKIFMMLAICTGVAITTPAQAKDAYAGAKPVARVAAAARAGTQADRGRLSDVMARLQMDLLVARITAETAPKVQARTLTRVATRR